MSSERPMNRRRFFREGLRELLKPLADVIQPLEEAARQLGSLESTLSPSTPASSTPAPAYTPVDQTRKWLRPPGAMSNDSSFVSACSRCGECVRVCPAQCIRIDYAGIEGDGAPYIDADLAACTLCDGILCTQYCPTGALAPISLDQIKMGTAVWKEDICVRREGSECSTCVDKCPLGEKAITITESRIVVLPDGCTGCGICQKECPTYPKAIVVEPRSGSEVDASAA